MQTRSRLRLTRSELTVLAVLFASWFLAGTAALAALFVGDLRGPPPPSGPDQS